jgi:hypothetical protein
MEDESKYIFFSIEDIFIFVDWVRSRFETPEEYNEWFETSLDYIVPPELFCSRKKPNQSLLFECDQCGAKFSTKAGLDVHDNVLHSKKTGKDEEAFWQIIKTSYKKETHETDLPDSD